jgi:Bacterial archaeo-eukaryotic release factor family 2
MTSLSGIDGSQMADLLDGTVPVASVYFDLRVTARSDALLRWRNVADELADQGAPVATVEALAASVLGSVPGPGVLAAFAHGSTVTLMTVLPGGELQDLARYGALPHLMPLLVWEQEHPARVVAVLDRTGADISVYAAGSTEPLDATVTGPDDEIERNAPGGWAQGRYQHRAEDSWEHNSAAVAAVLARLLRRFKARLLLLAGDVRALQYLEEHLPSWVHTGVTVRRVTGGRSEDGSAARQAEQLAEHTRQIVAERLEALLAEFADHLGTGGAAVEGVDETLGALAAGRVRVLLLPADTPDQPPPAWFGPGPTEVAVRPDLLRQAGRPAHEAALIDVAIRAALLTDAEVRILPAGQRPSFPDGVAALCRFTP